MIGYANAWWAIALLILFVALAIAGLVLVGIVLVRALRAPRDGGTYASSHQRAIDILDERYARGEITRAEYKEMRADLERARDRDVTRP